MTKEEWDLILSMVGSSMNWIAANPDTTPIDKDEATRVTEKFIEFVEAEKDSIS